MFFKELAKYNKFLIALLVAVVTVVVQFYGGNHYVQMLVTFLGALGVYGVPNKQA